MNRRKFRGIFVVCLIASGCILFLFNFDFRSQNLLDNREVTEMQNSIEMFAVYVVGYFDSFEPTGNDAEMLLESIIHGMSEQRTRLEIAREVGLDKPAEKNDYISYVDDDFLDRWEVPMAFRRERDHIDIYSRGPDRLDDGGSGDDILVTIYIDSEGHLSIASTAIPRGQTTDPTSETTDSNPN